MQPQDAIELVRQAALMALILGGPLLIVGMVVGLLVSLLQTLTQIQDQTLSAVPKIVAMFLALLFCLPWLTQKMLEYSKETFVNIPSIISR